MTYAEMSVHVYRDVTRRTSLRFTGVQPTVEKKREMCRQIYNAFCSMLIPRDPKCGAVLSLMRPAAIIRMKIS